MIYIRPNKTSIAFPEEFQKKTIKRIKNYLPVSNHRIPAGLKKKNVYSKDIQTHFLAHRMQSSKFQSQRSQHSKGMSENI